MATTTGSTGPTDSAPGQGRWNVTPLGRAWISIALRPGPSSLSFTVQMGIYVLTGHDPSTADVPALSANLAAGLPGLAILLVPCIAGVVYGWGAVRAGVPAGLVPAVLAALLGFGAVVLTVLPTSSATRALA